MSRRIGIALLAACLAPLSLAAAPNPDATRVVDGREVQDVVFFGEKRPALVRLHILIDGKPFRQAWGDFIQVVFKYYDADANGYLDDKEIRNVQPAQLLLGGNFIGGSSGAISMNMVDADKNGKVSREELAEYYRNNNGDVFNLQFVSSQANLAEGLTKAIFDRLDTNKDGALSRDELANAVKELYKLDSDDDENVSMLELAPNAQQLMYAGYRPSATLPDDAIVYVIQPNRGADRLAWHFQVHYGDQDTAIRRRKLKQKDIGVSREEFDRMDLNQDGVLDEDEIPRFISRTPDIEILFRLGEKDPEKPAVEVLSSKIPNAVRKTSKGVNLEVGTARLAIGLPEIPNYARVGRQNLGQVYVQQLKMADADSNGYLDKKEAERTVFRGNLFTLIDRDADGLLFEKEVVDYFKRTEEIQQKGTASRVNLTVADLGNGMFDTLDVNRDGRLSLRELRTATQTLGHLDRDSDGKVVRSEIPRAFELNLSNGLAGIYARQFQQPQFGQQQARPKTQNGPLWYRAMDRNGDGDISHREFLGTPEEFKKLDLDNDGLISLEEAEKADKLAQSKP
jgi:Ca2+-binding EF-hand superfamily protein